MAIIYYIATIIDEITKRYFGIAVVTTLRKKYDFYLSQLNNNYIIPYNKKKQTIIAVAKAYYYFFIAKILGLIESIAPSFAKSVVLKLKVYRSYAEQQVTIFSQTAQNLIDEWKHKGENIVEDLKQKGEKLHKRGEKVVEEFKLKNEGLRKKGETLLNEIQKETVSTESKSFILQLIVRVLSIADNLSSWVIGRPGIVTRFFKYYVQTIDYTTQKKGEYQTYVLQTITYCRSKSWAELATILIHNALRILDSLIKKYVSKSGLSLVGIKFITYKKTN